MKIALLIAVSFVWMGFLTSCVNPIFSAGPHIVGGCYDSQVAGSDFESLYLDDLGARSKPPVQFLYHWTPAGMQKESQAMITRRAVIQEWRTQRGEKLFNKGWIESTSAEFIVFDDTSRFHQNVSSFLSEKARTFVVDHTDEASWRDWLGLFHTGDFDHYESLSVYLHCDEENVVSVELIEGCFPTRGGSYDIYEYNFINEDGVARLFALSELFVPGSGWEKKLSDFCLAEFRRNVGNASRVADGTITSFTPEDLARFTVSRKELQIHFACFQVTLDGGGASEVDIPWSELQAYLRPDGPARFLVAYTDKAK
jgi:hypothetical protein